MDVQAWWKFRTKSMSQMLAMADNAVCEVLWTSQLVLLGLARSFGCMFDYVLGSVKHGKAQSRYLQTEAGYGVMHGGLNLSVQTVTTL